MSTIEFHRFSLNKKSATIRDLRDQTPFRPFEVHLADGRALLVVTPAHIMISPTNQEFALYQADGTLNVVDASLITSINPQGEKSGWQVVKDLKGIVHCDPEIMGATPVFVGTRL